MPSGFQSQTRNGSPTRTTSKISIFVHIQPVVRRGSPVIFRALGSCVPRECGPCVALGPPPSLPRAGTARHDFPTTAEFLSACREPPRWRPLSAPDARGGGAGWPVGESAREHHTQMRARSSAMHLLYTQWGAVARWQCGWGETGRPPPAISPATPLAYALGGERGMGSDAPCPATLGISCVEKRGAAQPPPRGWRAASGVRGAHSHSRTSRDFCDFDDPSEVSRAEATQILFGIHTCK